MDRSGKRKRIEEVFDRGVSVAATGAAVFSFLVLLFNVMTHFPFFDETVHVHYLWLFSEGLRPGADFFCTYPALGYLLTLPLMHNLPESAFVVLALRCVAVVLVIYIGVLFYRHGERSSHDWSTALMPFLLVVKASAVGAFFSEYSIDHMAAAAAFSAITVVFGPPRLWSVAVSAALCTLSVAITPKYPLPLFFGLLGYLLACGRIRLGYRKVFLTAAAGVCAALIGILLIFALTNTSWTDNFRHAFMLNYRWSRLNAAFGLHGNVRPLIATVLEFFSRNLVLCTAVVLGVAGWAKRSWRNPDTVALAGGGILLGTLLSSLIIKDFASQYVAPIVLCLALYVPYAFSLVRTPSASRALRLLLVAGAFLTLMFRIDDVAMGFRETPFNARAATKTQRRAVGKVYMGPTAGVTLSEYSELLEIIPPGERIVAAWPYHPIFRRDQTVIAIDTRPSYFNAVSPEDFLKSRFDPEYFRASLEKSPPALIYTPWLEYNYPPGWKQVAEDFLSRHRDLYAPYKTRFFEYPVRRDLLE